MRLLHTIGEITGEPASVFQRDPTTLSHFYCDF